MTPALFWRELYMNIYRFLRGLYDILDNLPNVFINNPILFLVFGLFIFNVILRSLNSIRNG